LIFISSLKELSKEILLECGTDTTLGRGDKLGIHDHKLSRKQVEVKISTDGIVKVTKVRSKTQYNQEILYSRSGQAGDFEDYCKPPLESRSTTCDHIICRLKHCRNCLDNRQYNDIVLEIQ
jgi:hypothetical protein